MSWASFQLKGLQPEPIHASSHGHQLGLAALAAEVHEGLLFSLSNDATIKVVLRGMLKQEGLAFRGTQQSG